MRRWGLWLAGMGLVWGAACQQGAVTEPARTRANQRVEAPASQPNAATPVPPLKPVPPPEPPAPPPPRKEIVIAWEASLLYLLVDGKPVGKPLVINSARHQYLRDAHLGTFEISEKIREWRSNLFDGNGDPLPDRSLAETQGAIMRNWMRLGDGAVGLHYSPAFRFHLKASHRHRSHGCYRMSKEDSNRVFEWAPRGTPVHVVRSLGGTKWAFLRAHTPPELLPGYVCKRDP